MAKMNNKGFAISTIIYGLSIMGVLTISILMGIMSTTRANTRKMAKSIEEELIRFSKTDVSFGAASVSATDNSPKPQEYIVPNGQSGWYLIELWGTQGGATGGYGAYTSGVIHLQEGDTLYFYVGKNRTGKSGYSTDVRLINDKYCDTTSQASKRSYETRIMVAAGGGTNPGSDGGTLYGYSSTMKPIGGKISTTPATGLTDDYNLIPTSQQTTNKTNGTLSGYPQNYNKSAVSYATATLEVVKPHINDSGGDGYIASSDAYTGGVSFISGYAGCRANIKGGLSTNDPTYKYYEFVYDDSGSGSYAPQGTAYYFYDGKMIPGVNKGDGKAKISRIVEETDTVKSLTKRNKKMLKVTKVRDCLSTTNISSNIKWDKISVMVNGEDKAVGKMPAGITTPRTGYSCKEIDLGGSYDIDEFAVWHNDGVDYKQHTMEVYTNNVWQFVKAAGSETELSETESVTGYRVSAYQPDYTQKLPESGGNYYIIPVLTENKAISAYAAADDESDPVEIDYIDGKKRQIWTIQLIDEKLRIARGKTDEYKIIELARYKSLEIYEDENIIGNHVRANTKFNSYGAEGKSQGHDPEIWKIIPVGNGTYQIKTVVPSFDSVRQSGNLCAQSNQDISANKNKILIAPINITTARFKLISISY